MRTTAPVTDARRLHVAVCSGRDCRQRDEHAELARDLATVADVTLVRCLGLCHSPVVAVVNHRDGESIFERVRSPKQRRDLLRYVAGRSRAPSKRLAKRLVTGKPRRRTSARLARRLAR